MATARQSDWPFMTYIPTAQTFYSDPHDIYVTVKLHEGKATQQMVWNNVKYQYRGNLLDILTPTGEIYTYNLEFVVTVYVTPCEKDGFKADENYDYSDHEW